MTPGVVCDTQAALTSAPFCELAASLLTVFVRHSVDKLPDCTQHYLPTLNTSQIREHLTHETFQSELIIAHAGSITHVSVSMSLDPRPTVV